MSAGLQTAFGHESFRLQTGIHPGASVEQVALTPHGVTHLIVTQAFLNRADPLAALQ